VIPFVDRTYRTVSSDRAAPGRFLRRSVCDLRTGATTCAFSGIVAASPALIWDDRLLFAAARQKLLKLQSPVRLDLSVGDEDEFGFAKDIIAFAKLLDDRKQAGLDYRFTALDENWLYQCWIQKSRVARTEDLLVRVAKSRWLRIQSCQPCVCSDAYFRESKTQPRIKGYRRVESPASPILTTHEVSQSTQPCDCRHTRRRIASIEL
jgi:hypothetical protein